MPFSRTSMTFSSSSSSTTANTVSSITGPSRLSLPRGRHDHRDRGARPPLLAGASMVTWAQTRDCPASTGGPRINSRRRPKLALLSEKSTRPGCSLAIWRWVHLHSEHSALLHRALGLQRIVPSSLRSRRPSASQWRSRPACFRNRRRYSTSTGKHRRGSTSRRAAAAGRCPRSPRGTGPRPEVRSPWA